MTSVTARASVPAGLRRAGAVLAAGLALAASCAPPPRAPVPTTEGGRRALCVARLGDRERRAVMAEAAATLWTRVSAGGDTCAWRRLPTVRADMALAWPDRVRLRVDSAFGTALDAACAGESLTAYLPPRGVAMGLDAAREPWVPREPGRLAVRLASATWQPPDSAWSRGTWEDDLLVLRWSEDGDSLTVGVDAGGLPAWVRLTRGDRWGLLVHYERWEGVEGVAWPAALRVRDQGETVDLVCRFDQVRFRARPDDARLAVRVPGDAEWLGMDEARELLGGVAGRR